jgi:hypothetical protein
LQACHLLGFRQSHSALTLPSNDAYAIVAADANQAILLQALSLVISNVLLLQASCQARNPSLNHSQSICICYSPLLLATPAQPSTTAILIILNFMRKKSQIFYCCKPRLPSRRSGAVRSAAQRQVGVSLPAAFWPPQLGSSRRQPVFNTSLSPKLDALQRGWNVYALLCKLHHKL